MPSCPRGRSAAYRRLHIRPARGEGPRGASLVHGLVKGVQVKFERPVMRGHDREASEYVHVLDPKRRAPRPRTTPAVGPRVKGLGDQITPGGDKDRSARDERPETGARQRCDDGSARASARTLEREQPVWRPSRCSPYSS